MVRKIVGVRDPVLRTSSKPVGVLDKKVKTFIADMRETLKAQEDPEGVGLAAPQVGKNLQIFVINYENTDKAFVNPKILASSKQKKSSKDSDGKEILEGCLSLPHYYGPLERANKVTLKYTDEEGREHVEDFEGFLAQIVQHEMDHLRGVLFVDRIIEQQAPLYKVDGDKWEEVELT